MGISNVPEVAADGASLNALKQRATVLEREARWAEAEAIYRELFLEAIERHSIEWAVDAARFQARACWSQDRHLEAEELAQLSWLIAERCGYIEGAARAVNLLAAIYHSQGGILQAKELYRAAQAMALDAGDDATVGNASQNLGIIANVSGDLREARALYLEAIASTARSGNTHTAAAVYNNLGVVCTDLEEWMEAELYFARGIEIAEQTGTDTALLAALHANRAKPLIQVGELAAARSSLAAAETTAACIGDRGTLAEVEVSRGTIARLEGDLTAADAHLARAVSLTADDSLEREHALAIEAVARLCWDQSRTAEALEQLRRASETFRAVGSRRDAARVEELLTEWEVQAGAMTTTR